MAERRLSTILSHLSPYSVGTHRIQNRHCSSKTKDNFADDTASTSLSVNDGADSNLSIFSIHNSENLQSQTDDTCVFCKISQGLAPASKVYEDETCLCILDVNPLSHGHSLVIPKRHFSSLEATPPSVVAAMCSVIPMLSSAIMKATNCDSFNLLVNNGAAAGQVIFHTHIHIIPRQAHDKLWKTESVQRCPPYLNQEANLLAQSIRGKLTKLL